MTTEAIAFLVFSVFGFFLIEIGNSWLTTKQ